MIAVLFARQDSIYKTLPGLDVYDKERDALNYKGGSPVIAHPPCRGWGRLRRFAKPEPGETELAIWAIEQVRQWGGVLEHPETSLLWRHLDLPLGSKSDSYGGFTLSIDQHWFGHRARKRTWLYICGIDPADIPPYPLRFELITHGVGSVVRKGHLSFKPKISKPEREHTPLELAKWLIELTIKIQTNGKRI